MRVLSVSTGCGESWVATVCDATLAAGGTTTGETVALATGWETTSATCCGTGTMFHDGNNAGRNSTPRQQPSATVQTMWRNAAEPRRASRWMMAATARTTVIFNEAATSVVRTSATVIIIFPLL